MNQIDHTSWFELSLQKQISRFQHSFQDLLNPCCVFGNGKIGSRSHYLLRCSVLVNKRITLLSSIRQINPHIFRKSDSVIITSFLYDNKFFALKCKCSKCFHIYDQQIAQKLSNLCIANNTVLFHYVWFISVSTPLHILKSFKSNLNVST